MKVKVIVEFRDRTDGLKLRKVGTVLEVSEERANKLSGMGLVKVIPEPDQTEAETESVAPAQPAEQQTEPVKKPRSRTKRTGTQ